MREILFRAKTEPNAKSSMTGKIIKKPKWIYGYIDLGYMHDCKTALIGDEKGNNVYKCQYETIGQYTGLTDKNGKKIFEGDNVNFKTTAYHFKNCRIKYQSCYARYCAIDNKGYEYPMDKTFEYEVIGNIHDIPELLKEREGK